MRPKQLAQDFFHQQYTCFQQNALTARPARKLRDMRNGKNSQMEKGTMDLVILPLAAIWPSSPFCKPQWIKAFVSCILPNAGVCNNLMWIGHLSEKASPRNWDFARPTSVNSCHPFQVVKQQETWELIFLPLANLFCGLSRFIFRSQELKIVILMFQQVWAAQHQIFIPKKRGPWQHPVSTRIFCAKGVGESILWNLQYLEDRPRYRKWLGSSQCISHKFRPVGIWNNPNPILRGPKTKSCMVINHLRLTSVLGSSKYANACPPEPLTGPAAVPLSCGIGGSEPRGIPHEDGPNRTSAFGHQMMTDPKKMKC